ncbi:MAG: hypothetical protein WC554_12115 [Clostridia bacterium]|nr:hypothetical protein [Clostridia bacterium]MDD4501691.1 hypothetical protein [Clostridia bacterium]NLV34448.1 hypothetical protein [Clostridiaceae bacterium]HQM97444.1 hypothetical protein [Clostridia bacterium]HQO70282.1 hypothetical protein [Clostridia bacterium]
MTTKDLFKSKKKKAAEDLFIPPEKVDEYIKAREAADKAPSKKKDKQVYDAILFAKGTNVGENLDGGINRAIGKLSG